MDLWNKIREFIDVLSIDKLKLAAEVVKLRDAITDEITKDLYIKELINDDNNTILSLEGGALKLISGLIIKQFILTGATNYVEMSLTSSEILHGERFLVTIQKISGKTPHEIANELRKEIGELKSERNWV
jgi:hypothetical protein